MPGEIPDYFAAVEQAYRDGYAAAIERVRAASLTLLIDVGKIQWVRLSDLAAILDAEAQK